MGPGTYNPHESFLVLKQRPCPTVIKKSSAFLKEECYEVVNNVKVFQPKYIRDEGDRRELMKRIGEYKQMKMKVDAGAIYQKIV